MLNFSFSIPSHNVPSSRNWCSCLHSQNPIPEHPNYVFITSCVLLQTSPLSFLACWVNSSSFGGRCCCVFLTIMKAIAHLHFKRLLDRLLFTANYLLLIYSMYGLVTVKGVLLMFLPHGLYRANSGVIHLNNVCLSHCYAVCSGWQDYYPMWDVTPHHSTLHAPKQGGRACCKPWGH